MAIPKQPASTEQRLLVRTALPPASVDAERRTVEVVWSTGARVLRQGWDGPFYEELSLDPAHVRLERLNNGAPFLANHDAYSVARTLAVVESARISKGKGTAKVRFPSKGVSEESDQVFELIREGIVQNVSVGYRIHKAEKIESADNEIPTLRVIDWEPHEISAVAIGADDAAGFRSSEVHNQGVFATRGSSTMAEKVEAVSAQRAAQIERERCSGILSAVRSTGLEQTFADKLIADGTALDRARELVLNEAASRSDAAGISEHQPTETYAGRISMGDSHEDKQGRCIESALISKMGGSLAVERAAQLAKEGKLPPSLARVFEGVSVDPGMLRNKTVADLAGDFLQARGQRIRTTDRARLVEQAFNLQTRASSSDFPVLFENSLNKHLLAAYAIQPDSWRHFCGVKEVQDFRDHKYYRAGSFGVLETVAEGGEYRNIAVPDGAKTSVSTATRGNIVTLTRVAIINDDLSALGDMAQKLGRAAGLSIEAAVYALLLENAGLGPTQGDGQPFFHSNRANVNGTGSALGVAGIDADRVIVAQQKDISSNEFLDLRPHCLVVPIGLGGAARVLNLAQYDVTESAAFQKPNRVAGLFAQVCDSPRLSGTRRYLFADPGIAPAMVIAFLSGQGEGPTVETQQGWRVDGTEWKIRFDFRAQMFDPKGAVTNAGV